MSEDDTSKAAASADGRLPRLFLSQNGIGGWLAAAAGAVCIWEGLRLGLGSLSRMGPGYFPAAIGGGLLVCAALLIAGAWRQPTARAIIPVPPRVVLVFAGLCAFAVLLPSTGLIPATIVLMLSAAWAITGRIGLVDVLFAVTTAVVAALVFIGGLGVVLAPARWPF